MRTTDKQRLYKALYDLAASPPRKLKQTLASVYHETQAGAARIR